MDIPGWGTGVVMSPPPVIIPVTPVTTKGLSVGIVLPGWGIGIHWGTLQQVGSFGSATIVQLLGTDLYMVHLGTKDK